MGLKSLVLIKVFACLTSQEQIFNVKFHRSCQTPRILLLPNSIENLSSSNAFSLGVSVTFFVTGIKHHNQKQLQDSSSYSDSRFQKDKGPSWHENIATSGRNRELRDYISAENGAEKGNRESIYHQSLLSLMHFPQQCCPS